MSLLEKRCDNCLRTTSKCPWAGVACREPKNTTEVGLGERRDENGHVYTKAKYADTRTSHEIDYADREMGSDCYD